MRKMRIAGGRLFRLGIASVIVLQTIGTAPIHATEDAPVTTLGVRDCAPLLQPLPEATAAQGGQILPETMPTYRIRTTMPGAQSRFHVAILGVPTPVDVAGTPAPDLIVELAGLPPTPLPVGLPVVGPVTGALRMVVREIVPGILPVEVVAQVVINPTTNDRVAFGYDGRSSDAPTHFVATLASLGGSSFQMITEAHETAGSLRLVGGATRPNASSATAFITMTPMPITMDVIFAAHPDSTPAAIVVTTPVSARLDASVDTISFDGTVPAWVRKRIDVTLDKLVAPQSRVVIAPGGGTIEYAASGPTSAISFNLQEFRNDALHSQVAASLRDVPWRVLVERDTTTAARIRPAGAIGNALVGVSQGALAECRTDQGPDDASGLDYVYRKEQSGWSSTVARFAGVSFADVSMSAGRYHAQLTHPSRPLHVLGFDTAQTLVDAMIVDVPPNIVLDYWPAEGRVSYTASGGQRIAQIDAQVSRPTPLFDRVKNIRIFGTDFPPVLNVTVAGGSDGAISLDAGDSHIGFIHVVLTAGPVDQLPVPHDALLVRNLGPDFVVEFRITSLRRLMVTRPVTCSAIVPDRWFIASFRNECTSAIHAELDTKPQPASPVGRPFSVFFTQKDIGGVKDEYVNVDVGPLTPKVVFDFWTMRTLTYNSAGGEPVFAGIHPALTRAVYRGADEAGNDLITNGLRVTTNIGQRDILTAEMFPLPAVIDLCLAVRAALSQNYDGNGVPDPGGNDFADDDCTRRGKVSSDGSMAFGATSYTTINLFDCATPAVGCTHANKRNYMQIDNLTVKNVAFQMHKTGGNPHHFYLNTAGTSLTGTITLEDKDETKGVQAQFANVWAQDRVIEWNGSAPPITGGSGQMFCTGSDALWVWDPPLLPTIDLLDWTGICNA